MALEVGKTDAFERKYMGQFRALAAEFGEFVEYSRDRAGRDIGIHFVEAKRDGSELVTPSLVWFQMKGIMSGTLPLEEYKEKKHVSISLDVSHLRFWYIAPEPTFLALYIESADTFLVLNLKRYVAENFGDDILTWDQQTKSIKVSCESELDEQAFYLIKKSQSVAAWKARIKEGDDFAHVFFRDANLIWRLGQVAKNGARATIQVRKYGSKMRTEVYFYEHPADGEKPVELRSHWQYAMPDDLRRPFPYLSFDVAEDEEEASWWEDDDDWDTGHPPIELPNGKLVQPNGAFEIVDYEIDIELNEIGKAWLETLEVMETTGFIEINKEGADSVSVAPWHGREV